MDLPGSHDRLLLEVRRSIAANEALQVLVTHAHWPSDAAWAIPAWETVITTFRLAPLGARASETLVR
jgi:hypothetical protein